MLKTEDDRYKDVHLVLAGHNYRGVSVGSEMTNHQFPGYKLCFDIGNSSMSSTTIDNVFITHGHNDHIGGLGKHFLRRESWGLPPATYYAQANDIELIKELLNAQCALNRSTKLQELNLVAVHDDSVFPLAHGKDLFVTPFKATHKIPCTGYAINRKVTKLKSEYVGIPAVGVAALRKSGVEITESKVVVEVAFPGDTNLNILHKPAGEVIRKARVLLLECTFLDDAVSTEDAVRTGHIHLDDFIVHADNGEFEKNEVILLTHFSARYDAVYIKKVLTEKLKNKAVWSQIQLLIP